MIFLGCYLNGSLKISSLLFLCLWYIMNMSLWVRTQLSACDFEHTENGHSVHDPVADARAMVGQARTLHPLFASRLA